jgi:peptidylprolyl isomerase
MRRHRFLIAPMLVAMLAFAACGDENSSSDETAAAPTKAATEAPTEAAPAAPTEGESGVKVTGKLGEVPKLEVPKGGTPPSGLVIEDIEKGKGAEAAAGQTVSVQYYGALYKDGTKFDASWDRGGEPFEFSLGAGMVIPGWDKGLVGMKAGGRRVLVIPPDMAYGESGSGPIGPNETLVFVVDMEKITSP